MKPDDIKLLRKNGWEVECMSPFEIRHENGSFASMIAAKLVLNDLRNEEEEQNKTIKALKELNAIELQPLFAEHTTYIVDNEHNRLFNNQQKILKALKIIGNNTIFYDLEDE